MWVYCYTLYSLNILGGFCFYSFSFVASHFQLICQHYSRQVSQSSSAVSGCKIFFISTFWCCAQVQNVCMCVFLNTYTYTYQCVIFFLAMYLLLNTLVKTQVVATKKKKYKLLEQYCCKPLVIGFCCQCKRFTL